MISIRPYKKTSQGARALRDATGIPFTNKYNHNTGGPDTVLNWGGTAPINSSNPFIQKIYNHPENVRKVVDKISFLQGVRSSQPYCHPRLGALQFTRKINEAAQFFNDGYTKVYCRQLIKSNKGKGIVIATCKEELVPAPLYTVALECKREYRVHMFQGNMIDLTAKVRVTDPASPYYQENVNEDIRNLAAGYVFAREAVNIPLSVKENLKQTGRNVMDLFGLNFGAIDVIRTPDNKYYPLELNTAPGLTGTTLARYVEAISKLNT